jgi:hypothetical protein
VIKIEKDLEESGQGTIKVLSRIFLVGLNKITKISVVIADVPVKIETEHLLTTSLELCCWTKVLCGRPLCSQ